MAISFLLSFLVFFLKSLELTTFLYNFATVVSKHGLIMETKTLTHTHRTPEEIKEWFRRAKARQQQLEEEGKRMWEEEQRIKAEAKQYYELEYT